MVIFGAAAADGSAAIQGKNKINNVSLLKEKDSKKQFKFTLKNRFQVLEHDLEADSNVEGKTL